MIVGGGALLVYMDDNGWGASLGVLALCMVLCSVPLLLNGPIPRHTEVQTIPVAPVNAPHFLRLPENGSWLFVLVLYKTGDAFGTGSIKPMLVDFGAGLSEVGWLLGTLGSSSAVVGSVIGAFLTTRVRIALPLFAGLQALSLALWTVTTVWPTQSLLIASVASEHFCSGLATTALFTEMMARCRPGLGASDYTAQASTVLTAQGIATILSAVSAEQLGYTGHHALATLVASLAVWVTIRGRG